MRYELLEVVVLQKDLPEHGLHRGELGTVVELYPPEGLEVEFLTPSGDTEAVVTLSEDDVRRADESDLKVRPSDH